MPSKRPSLQSRVAQMPESSPLWGDEQARQEVIELPITEIMPNAAQPRQSFDQAALEELAATIREHGVISPVIVRPIPVTRHEGHVRKYELVAGERRWRASQLAGLAVIPAIIRQVEDADTLLELSLIENLQRADLHPLEEGQGYAQLMQLRNYRYQDVAKRIGKSVGYVQNRIRLTQLPPDLQALVRERPDTLSHMVYLGRIDDTDQRAELLTAVRDDRLSLAETRARVDALLAPPSVDVEEGVGAGYEDRQQSARASSGGSSYLRKYETEESSATPRLQRDIERLRTTVGRWQRAKFDPTDQSVLLLYLSQLASDIETLITHLASGKSTEE